jgi:hypothetical protein
LTKWPYNIPASSIARTSKINPHCDFWFENKSSGNPASEINICKIHCDCSTTSKPLADRNAGVLSPLAEDSDVEIQPKKTPATGKKKLFSADHGPVVR